MVETTATYFVLTKVTGLFWKVFYLGKGLHKSATHFREDRFSYFKLRPRNLWMRCYTTLVSPTCSTSGIIVLSDVGLYIVLIDDILEKLAFFSPSRDTADQHHMLCSLLTTVQLVSSLWLVRSFYRHDRWTSTLLSQVLL